MNEGLGVVTGRRRNQEGDDPPGDPDQGEFAGVERAISLLEDAAEAAGTAAPEVANGIRLMMDVARRRLRGLREEAGEESGEEPENNSRRQYRERPGPRPKSGSFESGAAFRAAMKDWRRKKAAYEGEATTRGRTPGSSPGPQATRTTDGRRGSLARPRRRSSRRYSMFPGRGANGRRPADRGRPQTSKWRVAGRSLPGPARPASGVRSWPRPAEQTRSPRGAPGVTLSAAKSPSPRAPGTSPTTDRRL